ELRKLLPDVPVLALTASATEEVRQEILENLLMKNPEVIRDSFARPNLHYHVIRRDDQLPYIERLLTKTTGSSIVYVRQRRKCKELADWFSCHGITAAAYHGGMQLSERDKTQEDWIKGQTKVIVATNAFGMGVDKGDVRLVVHIDLPPGIEEYYQEAGRAGRDGNDAYCIIVLKPSSENNLQSKTESNFPGPEELKRVYKALHIYLDTAVGSGLGETFDFDLDSFSSKYGIRSVEAHQALDIIAKDGWLTVDESSLRGSQLQIIVDVETLQAYQVADPSVNALSKALLRGYEGLWSSPVYIQESKLARYLEISEAEVIRQLQQMQNKGIVDYSKPATKSQLTLLRERVPEQNFTIDMKAYAKRKEKAYARMNSMIAYLDDSLSCREKFIRNYFDEPEATDCGKCDRCRSREKRNESWLETINQTLREHDGITVKDFLAKYQTAQQGTIKKELRQLAEEHKIRIVEDKIFRTD
ncbi:MAG: helicase-related protein, partial [Saprospiraceae bacterium]